MPEATYYGEVEQFTSTWRRPRAWWKTIQKRAEIKIESGIPIPGKGENSWDCDQDAIYSLTTTASNLEEVIACLKENVMETRDRYGGAHWAPEQR